MTLALSILSGIVVVQMALIFGLVNRLVARSGSAPIRPFTSVASGVTAVVDGMRESDDEPEAPRVPSGRMKVGV